MITIDVKISSSLKHIEAIQAAAGKALVAQITTLVADIRDPKTGEAPRITQSPHPEGIKVSVHGTDWIRAEAERRISAMKT